MLEHLSKISQMSANSSDDRPENAPHPAIIRPRPGPRNGALRTVHFDPTLTVTPSTTTTDVAVQGMLSLVGLAVPTPTDRRTHQQTVARRRTVPEFADAELHQVARQMCRGLVEVLYGDRGVNQLLRCTTERVYNDIARRSAIAKSGRRMTHARPTHARLERVRIQRPNAKAIEVCARLRQGTRSHALAARLEFVNGRWTCVALEAER